jgi:hypothetical protein
VVSKVTGLRTTVEGRTVVEVVLTAAGGFVRRIVGRLVVVVVVVVAVVDLLVVVLVVVDLLGAVTTWEVTGGKDVLELDSSFVLSGDSASTIVTPPFCLIRLETLPLLLEPGTTS